MQDKNYICGPKYSLCSPFRETPYSIIIDNPSFEIDKKVNFLSKKLFKKNKKYIIRSNSPSLTESQDFGKFNSLILENKNNIEDYKKEIRLILKSIHRDISKKGSIPQVLVQPYIEFDISGVASTFLYEKEGHYQIEFGKNRDVTDGGSVERVVYRNNYKPEKKLIKVFNLMNKVKKAYGKDIIIEWGIKNNKIYLLQVRLLEEKMLSLVDYYRYEPRFFKQKSNKKPIFIEQKNYPCLLDVDLVHFASSKKLIFKNSAFYYKGNTKINISNNMYFLKKIFDLEENVKILTFNDKNISQVSLINSLQINIKNLKSIYIYKESLRSAPKGYIDKIAEYTKTLFNFKSNRFNGFYASILSDSNNHFSVTSPRISENVWPEKETFLSDEEYQNILKNPYALILKELEILELIIVSNIRKILKLKPFNIEFDLSVYISTEEILKLNIPNLQTLINRKSEWLNHFESVKTVNKYIIYGNICGRVLNLNNIKDFKEPILLNEDTILVGRKVPPNLVEDLDKVKGVITTEGIGELSHIVLNAKMRSIPVMISENLQNLNNNQYIDIPIEEEI